VSELDLLKFPCDIAVKAIGAKDQPIKGLVLEIVRRHVNEADIGSIQVRNSRHGRYESVTITVRADSRAQLDAIYEALTAEKEVIMAL
jgi:putative lipoic acid-binding regulatory protein